MNIEFEYFVGDVRSRIVLKDFFDDPKILIEKLMGIVNTQAEKQGRGGIPCRPKVGGKK